MQHFRADSADKVWRDAASYLMHGENWYEQESRCGSTRELMHATFELGNPVDRWIVSRAPGISPAFAIAEVFWILSGRNDSKFLNFWNPALPKFTGSGDVYHGAYGYRIRNAFGIDQLERAYRALQSNDKSRQIVIQIWSPADDLPSEDGTPMSEDIPCNICSILKVRNGALEWSQVMRSNDLILGTPYNFIQFTTLQEVVAGWLGVNVGKYFQISDSLHVYESDLYKYSIKNSQVPFENTDSLALPKDESESVINQSVDILEALSCDDVKKNVLFDSVLDSCVPSAYKNMLLITAAYSARQRGWFSDMEDIVSYCNNPKLKQVWRNWV